jgi:hypothetical protein
VALCCHGSNPLCDRNQITFRGDAANSGRAWRGLKERTAWIILGHLDAKEGTWATLQAYDIVDRNAIGDARMPNVGDTLRITFERPLYILDYLNSGEQRRFEAPGVLRTERADLTGGVLKPGARVVVREVHRDAPASCDTLCTLWARVEPE